MRSRGLYKGDDRHAVCSVAQDVVHPTVELFPRNASHNSSDSVDKSTVANIPILLARVQVVDQVNFHPARHDLDLDPDLHN